MSNRWLRFGIALLAIGAAGAAGYRIFQQEQRLATWMASSRSADSAAETAIVTISELKAAMHAYVAEGQGDAFWTARAATLIDRLRASILALDAPATIAGTALTETLDSIDRLAAAERRAREHVRSGERLMAGDVIFTEARDVLDAMRLQIVAARTAVAEGSVATQAGVRREQTTLALGAAGILAFATLLLVIPGSGAASAATSVSAAPASALNELDSSARVVSRAPLDHADPAALGARNTPSTPRTPSAPNTPAARNARGVTYAPNAPGARNAPGAPGARNAPGAPGARNAPSAPTAPNALGAPNAPGAPSAPSAPSVSLPDAAAVCTELGRVSQSVEISSLLARAAMVLNASGAIVWMASPDRHEMFPAASAGYDERLLARIGAIKRDANNVTAAALRDAAPRMSPRQGASAAALAVPLLTPLGPVGVFSAEIGDVQAIDETRLAVATIFAAQLASLLGSMTVAATADASEAATAAKAQA